ncbi:creatininase family protein [Mycobacterium basiliense]|uniref:creatininase family protein n=1 Tax=Mycobacterium basiliense TaxID=2094119 RepID=UPI001E4F2EB1|nr:creatininase family protein [Mycobacterium basiliense]
MSISATTLAVVVDIIGSVARQNITALIVVNGHGGSAVPIDVIQQGNHPRTPTKVGYIPAAKTGPRFASPQVPTSAATMTTPPPIRRSATPGHLSPPAATSDLANLLYCQQVDLPSGRPTAMG